MRRKRIVSAIAVLSLLLIVSLVFASGLVDVSKLSLVGAPGTGASTLGTTGASTLGTTGVFVDPAYYYKDYLLQPIDSTFTVYVNISDVSDLFAWQVNMTWNKALLNVSRIILNEFLARSTNQTSSEALDGVVINATVNSKGSSLFAETILGNIGGITGNGRLVSVEFLVVGYGSCDLTIIATGSLATTLLSSTGATITISSKADGYFSNKLTGDVDGDSGRDVDGVDFGIFAPAYGSSPGNPANYNREADLNHDGYVDGVDFGLFAVNYGRHV